MSQDISSKVSEKELSRREFIIKGNLWKVVFVLMFPLFLYAVFSYIYSIIDTIMCSGISKDAVNAVGALSQVSNMITALGAGIASGGSILIAREIGRKDYERARQLSSTVFAFTFILAVLTSAIIIPLSEPLLRLFGISETSIAVGKGYFMISVATSSIMMINTVYLGLEKAKGSMGVITLLNMGVVLVKVALNAIFLYACGFQDMIFVSLATLIANSALSVYVFIRLFSKKYIFHFSTKKVDFQRETTRKIFGLSLPIFFGKFIFSLGKVVINGLCEGFGNDVVGALGVSNNMGGSITNPISSVEDSTSSIISTNLGAGNLSRAIKSFYIGLVYSLSIAIVGVTLITIFNDPVTLFFARSITDEAERVQYAKQISEVFFYEKMGIITLAINSSVLGLLYGFGYTRLSMVINIARVFVFRIPSFLVCQYLIPGLSGFQVAGISMGFSNICIGIVAIITAIITIYNIKKKHKIREENEMLTAEERKSIETYFKNYISNYSHYKGSGVWCYEDGVVLLGAYRLFKATRDKDYFNFALHYFEKNIAEDGSLPGFDPHNGNTDDLQSGVALYYINSLNPEKRFSHALDKLAEQFATAPRTKEGSFFHKGKYPYQVWLDGLYMAEPFYTLVAIDKRSLTMKKDIVRQFENVENHCKSQTDGLYYHAYDESRKMKWCDKETGRSKNVWLRSVGWLAMAKTDVASYFKDAKSYYFTRKIKDLLPATLDSLKPYEDSSTHMYYDLPVIKCEGNYLETSGSLMMAYSYMRGAREKLLPYASLADGIKIFEGVVHHSFDGTHLRDIVTVSGLDDISRDGSISYYLSEKTSMDDAKGVGPFMMAYAEYLLESY